MDGGNCCEKARKWRHGTRSEAGAGTLKLASSLTSSFPPPHCGVCATLAKLRPGSAGSQPDLLVGGRLRPEPPALPTPLSSPTALTQSKLWLLGLDPCWAVVRNVFEPTNNAASNLKNFLVATFNRKRKENQIKLVLINILHLTSFLSRYYDFRNQYRTSLSGFLTFFSSLPPPPFLSFYHPSCLSSSLLLSFSLF